MTCHRSRCFASYRQGWPSRCEGGAGRTNVAVTLARGIGRTRRRPPGPLNKSVRRLGARGNRALRNRVAIDGLSDFAVESVEGWTLGGWSGLLNPNIDLLLKGHIQILARRDAIGKIVTCELQHAKIIAVAVEVFPPDLSLRSATPLTRTAFQRVAGIGRRLNGLADLRSVVSGASEGDWWCGNDKARNASRTRGNEVSH